MKCGREIEEQQVFCPDCLAYMAQNPVKPGTVVKLPPRSAAPLFKKRRFHRKKRELKPEEKIAHQRIVIRRLILALAAAVLLLIATGFLLLWMFKLKNIVDIPDLGLSIAAVSACFT